MPSRDTDAPRRNPRLLCAFGRRDEGQREYWKNIEISLRDNYTTLSTELLPQKAIILFSRQLNVLAIQERAKVLFCF